MTIIRASLSELHSSEYVALRTMVSAIAGLLVGK